MKLDNCSRYTNTECHNKNSSFACPCKVGYKTTQHGSDFANCTGKCGGTLDNGINAKSAFLSANLRSKGEGKGKEEEGKGEEKDVCDISVSAKGSLPISLLLSLPRPFPFPLPSTSD